MEIIYQNGRIDYADEYPDNEDYDYKDSWGTTNRGYKLYRQQPDEFIPTDFFAFISNGTHNVFDFTNKEVYRKYTATGQYVQYPSMHYRTCTLISVNTCCIFVPNFKCLQEFILGFFVRVLTFSGYREKEKEVNEETGETEEKVYEDALESPIGHSSPIMLTDTNIYPISSGLTSHYVKDNGANSSIREYTSNINNREKANENLIYSPIEMHSRSDITYEYELSTDSVLHGWNTWSAIPGILPAEYLILGYMKAISWTTIGFLGYMSGYEALRKGMVDVLDFTISPIFFPSLIFFPTNYMNKNGVNYFTMGGNVEEFLNTLKNELTEVNDNDTYSITDDTLILSPKFSADLHLNYTAMEQIPLRPLCWNVTYRGFLPYYIQQSY